jgi:hypothetical protein
MSTGYPLYTVAGRVVSWLRRSLTSMVRRPSGGRVVDGNLASRRILLLTQLLSCSRRHRL